MNQRTFTLFMSPIRTTELFFLSDLKKYISFADYPWLRIYLSIPFLLDYANFIFPTKLLFCFTVALI